MTEITRELILNNAKELSEMLKKLGLDRKGYQVIDGVLFILHWNEYRKGHHCYIKTDYRVESCPKEKDDLFLIEKLKDKHNLSLQEIKLY